MELTKEQRQAMDDALVKEAAAEKLRKSEKRYEIAINGADLAVWEYNIKEHTITTNSERVRRYGVPTLIDNMPAAFLRYFPEQERDKLIRFFDCLAEGESLVEEEFWLQWGPEAPQVCERAYFSVITDADGQPDIAYGISMDVTAQKQQVRQYNQSMALLLSVNPEALGMLHFNLTKNNFIDCYGMSPETKRILVAQNFDEFVENVIRRIIYKGQQEAYRARLSRKGLLQAYAAGKTADSMEFYRDDGDGKSIWVRAFYNLLENPDTRDVEGVVYSLDISREKQQEDIFRIMTGQEYDLISLIDLETGTFSVIHASDSLPESYRRALPSGGEDMVLRDFCRLAAQQWIVAEDADDYLNRNSMAVIQQDLERSGHHEFTLRQRFSDCDDGYMYRKFRYYYLNNEKKSVLVVESDVTALYKKQQEELKREKELRQQAVAANAAKTEFLSRMSHDIRTPLNGIMGMTYIAGHEDNPPQTAACLRHIDVSSKFLLGLVNDVLDMAKAESGKIELHIEPYTWTEFSAYLQAVIGRSCEEKHLQFRVDAPPELPAVAPLMDKLRVNQIYLNLVSNAVKFTPVGGTVTLRVRYPEITAGRETIVVSVSDTGVGISPAFQKEMFQPFSQELRDDTADNRGSGLGLSIVKRLVDLMGGTISVESEIGKGTTFTVTATYDCIPLEGVLDRKGGTAADTERILSGRHVLVFEDHPLNQEIARTILEDKGMVVDIAGNGRDGVDRFAAMPAGHYDAILMDIHMPGMDGYEATAAIRALIGADASTVPIFAMTADAFAEDIEKCLAAGMNGHIAKPIDPDTMFSLLANAIKKRS